MRQSLCNAAVSVCPYVCLSRSPAAEVRGGFAAVGPEDSRYRSIAARRSAANVSGLTHQWGRQKMGKDVNYRICITYFQRAKCQLDQAINLRKHIMYWTKNGEARVSWPLILRKKDRDPAHSAHGFGQQVASLVLWFGLDDWDHWTD